MKADTAQFWKELEATDSMVLATSKDDVVTIRPVSPLRYGNEILFCTSPGSRKAAQILANPDVAVSLGLFYLQGKARCLGAALGEENAALKEAYGARYPGAFTGGDPQFSGDEVFISITPTKLNHWILGEDSQTLGESLL